MCLGIGIRDDEKRTLLHLINGSPLGEDISDMVKLLIQRLAKNRIYVYVNCWSLTVYVSPQTVVVM